MKFIYNDNQDETHAGDLIVFLNQEEVQYYVEEYDADDPWIHIYDERGPRYRVEGQSVIPVNGSYFDVALMRALLRDFVKRVMEEDPSDSVDGLLDQIAHYQRST